MSHPPLTPAQSDLAGFLASELGSVAGAYDELFQAPGEPREHWRAFLKSVEVLGRDELVHRAENGRRILREHGVSYLHVDSAKATEHRWELDFLPFIISAAEWRQIEAGVKQRAHLLNQIMRDVFGRQRLLRDGFLPAPLIYANPAYLRACQAIHVPDGNYLHTYAVDMVRAPDGQWWVLADRTQAPAGLGFALENRSVTARVLPEAMHAVRPRALSVMLRDRGEALRRLAPQNQDNPTIVLLTPGPRNEAYFEHAYLARVLGFTLCEGGDLTVRDRAVFVKTLDGLQRVDVILRRLRDAYCDPLELQGDSLVGVPGLVEAARSGKVAIANALGSGLLESPGFLPFLPGLSRQLLGEDLRLPGIATWWCGQGREFNHVREQFNRLSVCSAFSLAAQPALPGRSPEASRAAQLRELEIRPHEIIGQERVKLSRIPVMTGHRWEQRSLILRVFAMFNDGSFTVMPGGLARTVTQDAAASHALSIGGGSKDVWVLGEAHHGDTVHIVAPAVAVERTGSRLPSRTADNFYWLGRYTERLEHLARVSRCVIGRLNEEVSATESARIAALSRLLEQLGFIPGPEPDADLRGELQRELIATLHDAGRSPGVRELLQKIHLSAFAVRDRLSADTWRILGRLEPDARFRGGQLPLVHASSVLHALVLDLAAFSGMEMENMTRGHGWTFLDIGRRLERAAGLLRLLGAALRSEDLDQLLEPVLEIADSVMTHRRRYFSDLRPNTVLELLLADDGNPRSLAFQFARLVKHSAKLPNASNPAGVLQLREKMVALADAASRAAHFHADDLQELAGVLEGFDAEVGEVSELVTQVFFSHIVPRVN